MRIIYLEPLADVQLQSINMLSALMEKGIGEVFDSPETQSLIAYSVVLVNQISIEIGVGRLRDYEQFKAIAITKGHFSSLYYDLKTGKPGEIKAILDATMEIADLIVQQKGSKHILPDLKPLKTLKSYLELKAASHDVSAVDLVKLFSACEEALDSFYQKQHNNSGSKSKAHL